MCIGLPAPSCSRRLCPGWSHHKPQLDRPERDFAAILIPVTNPLERLNGEIKLRTEVVGIFPTRPRSPASSGAILLEQNDEWAVQRCRYMTLESVGRLSDDPRVSLPAVDA
jgi:hypothetical protein